MEIYKKGLAALIEFEDMHGVENDDYMVGYRIGQINMLFDTGIIGQEDASELREKTCKTQRKMIERESVKVDSNRKHV